jgi:hypothetical protein
MVLQYQPPMGLHTWTAMTPQVQNHYLAANTRVEGTCHTHNAQSRINHEEIVEMPSARKKERRLQPSFDRHKQS